MAHRESSRDNNMNLKIHPKVEKSEVVSERADFTIMISDEKEMSALLRILQGKIASGEGIKIICRFYRDNPDGELEIPP